MRSLVFFTSIVLCVGCSSTTPPGAGEVGCSTVCENIAARCATAPPGCLDACAALSASQRSCVANAATCAAVDACGSAAEVDAGAGGDAGGRDAGGVDAAVDPSSCGRCSGLEFCVRNAAHQVTGCWTPPETCDGAASSTCDACAYRAGSGPCEAGASSCSSGAAGRVIECR